MSTIVQSLSPASHRAAIDALEAQRAAYRRLARDAEAQQTATSGGDVTQASSFAESTSSRVDALHEGARATQALVDGATPNASAQELRELELRMDDMMREARNAELAIRNLTTQLEAWRDAYGRQLAELGIPPAAVADLAATGADASRLSYGATGFGRESKPAVPRILDRKG